MAPATAGTGVCASFTPKRLKKYGLIRWCRLTLNRANKCCLAVSATLLVSKGMAEEHATELLTELYEWQTRPEFQYHHAWHEHTLLLWDNRSVLHRANGGYDGFDRLLHRTTIYAEQSELLAVFQDGRSPVTA